MNINIQVLILQFTKLLMKCVLAFLNPFIYFCFEEKYLQVSTEPNKSVDICAVLDEITGL